MATTELDIDGTLYPLSPARAAGVYRVVDVNSDDFARTSRPPRGWFLDWDSVDKTIAVDLRAFGDTHPEKVSGLSWQAREALGYWQYAGKGPFFRVLCNGRETGRARTLREAQQSAGFWTETAQSHAGGSYAGETWTIEADLGTPESAARILAAAADLAEGIPSGHGVHIHNDGSVSVGTDGFSTTPSPEEGWGTVVYLYDSARSEDPWACLRSVVDA